VSGLAYSPSRFQRPVGGVLGCRHGRTTRRSPPPSRSHGYILPCIPTRAYKVPAGADWVHEIKHDGYKFAATATRSGCSPVAATTLTGRVLE
jgi:hypothetical protein